jgi:hypothetical protein
MQYFISHSKSADLSSQVELDLDMNAHANARAWHGDRKARTVKQQKTIEANKKALAVADKKVQIQLSKVGCSSPCKPKLAHIDNHAGKACLRGPCPQSES